MRRRIDWEEEVFIQERNCWCCNILVTDTGPAGSLSIPLKGPGTHLPLIKDRSLILTLHRQHYLHRSTQSCRHHKQHRSNGAFTQLPTL
ncbi:hypothetical protein FKM82_011731 [Ascaphus truei]